MARWYYSKGRSDARKAFRRRRLRRLLTPEPGTIAFLLIGLALFLAIALHLERQRPRWYVDLRDRAFAAHSEPGRTLPTVLRGGDALTGVKGGGASATGVTHVRDGDTVVVRGRPVRLASLDCAESGTLAGDRATRRMRRLVQGRRLSCRLTGERSYDRWIGTCRMPDGRSLSGIMIREGYCRRW